jgi:PAS domain S-box-containing protein
MTMNDTENRDERILILAPIGRDAAITARFLHEASLAAVICGDMEVLCACLPTAGVVFLTGEALTPEAAACLFDTLKVQPAWSDIPLVVLTSGGGATPANADMLAALGEAGNMILIERPVRGETLLSTVNAALRARRRQYDVRDHLEQEARAREDLRYSEERLRIALDAAQLGAWQLDLATGVLECTVICKANFGLPPEAVLTYDKLVAAIHPDDRDHMRACVEESLRSRGHYRAEYRVLWPDKSLHWVLASGRANYDADGNAVNMVGVTLDITRRKTAEHEREQLLAREQAARAEAEAASSLKDEFLATVSHELRTPLMAILGWSNLLRDEQIDAAMTRNGLETIERNARSQVQLINDLLDVSRIITGKLRLEMKSVDIVEVVANAVEAVRPTAEARNIQLHTQLDGPVAPLDGDAERLQQVVWNLLTNAIKFTPHGGQVNVLLAHRDSSVQITVSDTGKGIDAEFLSHVFDRFRQADQTSTRAHGGLGLGLSIVRQLVELHGGTIRATSDGKGQGSKFIVELPLLKSNNDQQAQSSMFVADQDEMDCPPPLKQLQVLVVDDEADTRIVLQAVLERCGSQVVVAASAAEALTLLEQWQPDVLVSDIGMPDQDGYWLIRQLRSSPNEHASIPALALTAYVREEDRAKALTAGFQIHLAKPVEPAELVKAVAQLAEQSTLRAT